MANESKTYEKNFSKLKNIAEELSRQEISIDEVISKGKDAASAAKNCINILKAEKGNFTKLEEELAALTNEMQDFMQDPQDE